MLTLLSPSMANECFEGDIGQTAGELGTTFVVAVTFVPNFSY